MIVSTLLLSKNGMYVDIDNNLPKRPAFDKQLLKDICKNKKVSEAGFEMLPASIKKNLFKSETPNIGITIKEIDNLSDLIIVSISDSTIVNGKKFRFDKFKNIYKGNEIELWIKK